MDLWPNDISQTNISSYPAQILKEQAYLLGEKTKNLVTAEVIQDESENEKQFKFSFLINSPVTGGYKFWVFSISHGIHFYPIKFSIEDDVAGEVHDEDEFFGSRTAGDEKEFLEILQGILSSQKVKRVVSSLLAMGQSGEKLKPLVKRKKKSDDGPPF